MDGDAFFVGCEVAKNPKLKGKPVVTGEEKGIVSALSYEAKALGITRGMPIFRLKKEFPQVLVLPGDYKSYAEYSETMFNIVRRYTEDVEEYSIDECFADLTGWDKPLKMSYVEIAQQIKKEINEELGLSISIGIAPSKVLAKIASNFKKPNGLTLIEEGEINNFLLAIPIEKVWGIGWKSALFFQKRGIKTAKDLVDKNLDWVKENLSKPYQIIWHELRGVSISKIDPEPKTDYKSVQKTRTFHPATNNKDFLLSELSKHTEEACRKVRYYDLVARGLSFFIKTKDFKYKSFETTLPVATNSPEPIVDLIQKYFSKVYDPKYLYRTAGLTLHGLIPKSYSQADLFEASKDADRLETIHQKIDELEEKYGKGIVHLASTHKSLMRKTKGTLPDSIDRDLLFL